MNKETYIIDCEVYPIAWRFNSEDCLLSDQEKQSIVFLDEKQSQRLWNTFIPAKNLMELSNKNFVLHEKTILSFGDINESKKFFASRLAHSSFVWFFWSACAAAIVPRQVFLKSWDDFFYPSDENSILLTPDCPKAIFSFEDTFFYGDLVGSYFQNELKE
ncbi:DUF2947 family protein [Pseudomonas sp. NPDC078416]|uniref:DUF2947 family protein n=1 Tax=Pseudomonas sp. NPDC078416 TaxID=3390637 RepID=UPI003D04440E